MSNGRSQRTLLVGMSGVILALGALGGAASYAATLQLDDPMLIEGRESFVRLFTLAGEANIPTWYASSTLLACSILLAMIAIARGLERDRYTRHWTLLAIVFLGLSLDESAILHEMSAKPLRALLHTSGLLEDAWVVLGSLVVTVLGVSYLGFLRCLPAATRRHFVAAAVLFLAGALGFDAVIGRHIVLYGSGDALYEVLTVAEELLEMFGVLVFLHGLLVYLRSHVAIVDFRIGGRRIDFVWADPVGVPANVSRSHEKELV